MPGLSVREAGVVGLVALLLLLAGGAGGPAAAQPRIQPSELGAAYPSRHYAPDEYGHYPQNWAIAQDRRGVVYVGNGDGVLQYDGERWRLIPAVEGDTVGGRPTVRSLATDASGTVYVGTEEDFGVLRPDSLGRLRYRSLRRHLPAGMQDVGDVWSTQAVGDTVYFQTRSHVFRWNGERMKAWSSDESFHTAFAVRGRFFVRDLERGLLEAEGDSLRLAPGGGRFRDTQVHAMMPHPGGGMLVGTRRSGLYRYVGGRVSAFPTGADDYVAEHGLYHGTALPRGHFALATLGGGVLVVDEQGTVVRKLTPQGQLPDGVVNHVYAGAGGELWMAFNSSGVMRASVVSPVSVFDERRGLEGTVRDIDRIDGRLYLATGMGAYVLASPGTAGRQRGVESAFERIPGIPIAFAVEDAPSGMLAATQEGVYRYRPSTRSAVRLTRRTAFDLEPSRHVPGRVYVATRSGVDVFSSLNRSGPNRSGPNRSGPSRPGRSEKTGVEALIDIDEKVQVVKEGEPGTLWLSTGQGTILRVSNLSTSAAEATPDGEATAPHVQRFGGEEGLPGGYKGIATVDGAIYVVSQQEIFRAERAGDGRQVRFSPAPSMIPEGTGTLRFLLPTDEMMWALRGNRLYRGRRSPSGTVRWDPVRDIRFSKNGVSSALVEGAGVVWLSRGSQLLRYDSSIDPAPAGAFEGLVRRVTTVGNETLLAGGRAGASRAPLQIAFAHNDLRFQVAAPLFTVATGHEYQYRLEGRKDAWSAWTKTPSVVYTNLVEGTYRLQVRARSERGTVSRPASFSFRIAPPWYRTAWAYAAYLLGGVLVLGAIYRYWQVVQEKRRQFRRAQHLEREKEARERLQQANERLRQANRLKETFLTATSHELRTPLTNILGFVDVVREQAGDEVHDPLDVIEENGKRLLDTLESLMNLASLRAGEMEPSLQRMSVSAVVKATAETFRDRAEEDGLAFTVDVPETPVRARLDEQYLRQILHNLIDNALKFTHEGEVAVVLRAEDGDAAIRVRDTGIGVDPDFVPNLFQDFKQESEGLARTYEGSGLGLAISMRLAELMGGTISVESEKGEGSTFTLRLPCRRSTASARAAGPEAPEAAGTEPGSGTA
jgi:signal transduction histidine kinase